MIATDKDALICDLAEVYGVHDMRAYSALHIATLAHGLNDDSRIKLKLSGRRISTGVLLSAAIFDKLSWLAWTKTADAEKNRNRPKSVLAALMGGEDETNDYMTFIDGDAFARYWNGE